MEKTQKNKKNIFSKLTKSFVALMVLFVSVFFAACSNSASTSGYDAYGKYRIAQARLTYYEATSDGETNEHTGSFLLPMKFYYDTLDKGEADNYDQDGTKPVVYGNGTSIAGSNIVYPDYTFTVDGYIYQVHVTVHLTHDSSPTLIWNNYSNYTSANQEAFFDSRHYVKATTTLDNIFSFTYRVGTNGTWLDANGFIDAVYLNKDQDIIPDFVTGSSSAQDDGNASIADTESFDRVFYMKFNPRLENGSTNRRIRVKTVPNMDMTYDPLTDSDKSKCLFQSAEEEDVDAAKRGDSVYSSTLIYQAYRMTFKTFSLNSSELDYGQLSYDKSRFYFYETEQTYSIKMTNANVDYVVNHLSMITGYFPSGRVVEVNRDFETIRNVGGTDRTLGYGNDYAFQSWSVNKKPVNTLALSHTFSSDPLRDRYNTFGNNFEIYDSANKYTCLFGIESKDTVDKVFTVNSLTTQDMGYASNTCYEYFSGRTGKLYVTSKQAYNNSTFYANYLRVHNFTLAGSIYDSDKILSGDEAELDGVTAYVYNINNALIDTKGVDPEFKITGLSYGDYLIFYKKVFVLDETTADPDDEYEVNYRFYGTDMSTLFINGHDVDRVLQNRVVNETKSFGKVVIAFGTTHYLTASENMFMYGANIYYVEGGNVYDRKGNLCENCSVQYVYNTQDITTAAILASKYDSDSSLIINFYAKENGALIDPTDAEISYEVIKSVTSYVDALGCVKTTVYLSVVLPSDVTLQSYNIVTDNSIDVAVYKNSNDTNNTIIAVTNLDDKPSSTITYTQDYYYAVTSSATGVTESKDGKFLLYDGIYYKFYTQNSQGTDIIYMFQSTTSRNMVAKVVNEFGSVSYEFLDLRKINASSGTNSYNSMQFLSAYFNNIDGGQTNATILIYNGYMFFNADNVFTLGKNTYYETPVKTTANGSTTLTEGGDGATSGKYQNEIIWNQSNSFIQKLWSSSYKNYAGDATISSSLDVVGTVSNTNFYQLQMTQRANLQVDSTTKWDSNAESLQLQTDISYATIHNFTNSLGQNIEYYTFNYGGVKYFIYNNEIYVDLNTDKGVFEDKYKSDALSLFSAVSFTRTYDASKESHIVTLQKLYYQKGNQRLYYSPLTEQFFNDEMMTNSVSLADDFGYLESKVVKISDTNYKIHLKRLFVEISGEKFYINPNSTALYTDFDCNKAWIYTDDTITLYDMSYDSNGAFVSGKLKIENLFNTRINFIYNGKTFYLFSEHSTAEDLPVFLWDDVSSTYVEVSEYVYNIDINEGATKTLNFSYGSVLKTKLAKYVSEGVTTPAYIEATTDSSLPKKLTSDLTIVDGLNATLFAMRYFGRGSTSIVAEGYKSDMKISAFLFSSQYLYIKADETHQPYASVYIGDDFNPDSVLLDKAYAVLNLSGYEFNIKDSFVDVTTGRTYSNIPVTKGFLNPLKNDQPFKDAAGNIISEVDYYYFPSDDYVAETKSSSLRVYQLYSDAFRQPSKWVALLVKNGSDYYLGEQISLVNVLAEKENEDDEDVIVSKFTDNGIDVFFKGLENMKYGQRITTMYSDSGCNTSYSNSDYVYILYTRNTIVKYATASKLVGAPVTVFETSYNTTTQRYSLNLLIDVELSEQKIAKFSSAIQSYNSNVYLYYDIEKYTYLDGDDRVTKYFSTTPLAKQSVVNGETEIQYYYGITNFEYLVSQKKIATGLDIYNNRGNSNLNGIDYQTYYKVCGAKLVNYYYYYVDSFTADDRKTLYCVQEASSGNNGQATIISTEYHKISDGVLYEGDVYTKRTINFETSFKGITSIKINGISGQSENIISDYVCDVTTSGTRGSFSFDGVEYYFTNDNWTNFVGKTFDVYYTASNELADFSITGYFVDGSTRKILINYMSFNAGANSGTIYLASSNGILDSTTAGVSAFKLSSSPQSASGNYTIISNMGGGVDPLAIASNNTVFGGDIYETKITSVAQKYYPSLIQYDLDSSTHSDIYEEFGVDTGNPHSTVRLGVYLIYTLYRCYASDLYSSVTPAPINIYIANVEISENVHSGYCFVEAYKKDSVDGVVTRLELLRDNSGQLITYEMLFGALSAGQSSLNLQYLFGSYQEETIIKYDNGIYYMKTKVNAQDYTYYVFNKKNGFKDGIFTGQFEDISTTSLPGVVKNKATIDGFDDYQSAQHPSYTFKKGSYYYYAMAVPADADGYGPIYRSTTDLSPNESNKDSYTYGYLTYDYIKNHATLVSGLKFKAETHAIYDTSGASAIEWAFVDHENNTITFADAADQEPTNCLKMVYDCFTEGVYFLYTDSILYTRYTLVGGNYVVNKDYSVYAFNYFYSQNDDIFEFRPNAQYFVFSKMKVVAYMHIEGTAIVEYKDINQSGFARDFNSGELIYSSTVVSAVNVEYFEMHSGVPDFTKPLNKVSNTQLIDIGNTSYYASDKRTDEIITILGKFTVAESSEDIITYNSFSSIIPVPKDGFGPVTPLLNDKGYYSVEYTNKDSATEGFPGVTLVDGAPYVNPIFVFDVYHKQGMPAIIDFSIMLNNGYYVDLITSIVENKEDTSNIITDFTAVSFKSRLNNLLTNDYIDNMYYVVDAIKYKTIVPYKEIKNVDSTKVTEVTFKDFYYGTYNKDYIPFMKLSNFLALDKSEQVQYGGLIRVGGASSGQYFQIYSGALKITDCAMNPGATDSNLYFADEQEIDTVTGNYVYCSNVYRIVNGVFEKLMDEDVALWESSTAVLNDVLYYDIHTYYQDEKTGTIYLTSDITEKSATSECIGLSGLTLGATTSSTSSINYDNVVVAGLTTVYKVQTSLLPEDPKNFQGYWFDKAISVMNKAEASTVYLKVKDESVVLAANPLISFDGEIYYRFKEWRVYERENAEFITYNQQLTMALGDHRESAIARFTSEYAGYFLFLPVYEKVYAVSLATAVVNGSQNVGGTINISSTSPAVSIDPDNYQKDLYFTQYIANSEGRYFSALASSPFLFFTGSYDGEGNPIFQKLTVQVDDINNDEKTSALLFYDEEATSLSYATFMVAIFKGTALTKIIPVDVLGLGTRVMGNTPCLIPVSNENGYINFWFYNKSQKLIRAKGIMYDGHFFIEHDKNEQTYIYTAAASYDYKIVTDALSYETTANNFEGRRTRLAVAGDLYYSIDETIFAKIKNFNNQNPASTPVSLIDDVLLEENVIGRSIIKPFSVARPLNQGPQKGDYYTSTENDLKSGELYADEDGRVYPTLQFKTSYYDRDSGMLLAAVPDAGYRLEGWYEVVYDDVFGWVVSEEDISKKISSNYSNKLIKTEFKAGSTIKTFTLSTKGQYPSGKQYTTSYSISSEKVDIYFSDDLTRVPQELQSTYSGIFVNTGSSLTKPNFVQLYAAGGDKYNLFYDEECTTPFVPTNGSKITEMWDSGYIGYMNYYDAVVASYSYQDADIKYEWNEVSDNVYISTTTAYRLNGEKVYALFEYNEGTFTYDINYYRTYTEGNYVLEGNTLKIKNIHSNIKYVAKFIDIYQAYIFNEPEEDSGISVEALYYYNENDIDKDVIRTNASGIDQTTKDLALTTTDSEGRPVYRNYLGAAKNNTDYSFSIQKGDDEEDDLLSLFDVPESEKTPAAGDYEKTYFELYYDAQSRRNFEQLSQINPHTGESSGAGAGTGSFGKNSYAMFATKRESLSLKNYYFDSGTTLFLLVRLDVDYSLSIHSLGLNSKYVLNFLMEPDLDAINDSGDDTIEYVYYLLKVTLDRSMAQTDGVITSAGNENPEYVLHPEKAKNIASDVLSGYQLDYYDNFFDLFVETSGEQNAYNIAEDNYMTFTYNGQQLKLKIAFDRNMYHTFAKTFSFSKYMAESLFSWLAKLQVFDSAQYTAANLIARPDIVIGSQTQQRFKYSDYIDDKLTGVDASANVYETVKKSFIFVFENLCYDQVSNSINLNFNTAITKLKYYLNNYLLNWADHNIEIAPISVDTINYYMTIDGSVYVTQNFIYSEAPQKSLLGLKVNEITNALATQEVLNANPNPTLFEVLSDFTLSNILNLQYKAYTRLGDFISELNQILYAASYVENAFDMSFVLETESYYAVSPIGNSGQYSSYVTTKDNRLTTINQIFYNVVKNIKQNKITTAGNVAAGDTPIDGTAIYVSAPANIYTYGPFVSGRINYINLSSITIYTISVSTSILDSIEDTNEKYTDQVFTKSTSNFKDNPYYILDDKIYTSGGVASSLDPEGLTYIGDATEADEVEFYYVDGYATYQRFATSYIHTTSTLLYEQDKGGGVRYTSYGDMSFAEYSIILWGGLRTHYNTTVSTEPSPNTNPYNNKVTKTSTGNTWFAAKNYKEINDGKYVVCEATVDGSETWIYEADYKTVYVIGGVSYADIEEFDDAKDNIIYAFTFAGWYSQTYDRDTRLWSDMECVTTDLVKPFVTAATADTNIVAIFTAVTNVSYTYDPKAVHVSFDSTLDSCGNEITSETNDDGTITISGWYYFSSAPSVMISPIGGYRIADTYSLTYIPANGTNSLISSPVKPENEAGTPLDKISYADAEFPITFISYVGDPEHPYQEVKFEDLSLTNVSYIQYSLSSFLTKTGDVKKALLQCEIVIDTEFVVLSQFKVEGFISNNTTTGKLESLKEFYLYSYELNGSGGMVAGTKEVHAYVKGFTTNPAQTEFVALTIDTAGKDSAHNPLIIRAAGNALEVIGYFDYNKFNGYINDNDDYVKNTHNLIAGLNFANATERDSYGQWFANETTTSIGDSPNNDQRKFFNSYAGKTYVEDIITFYDAENPSSSVNTNAKLDDENHVILLKAKTSKAEVLGVTQKFYSIHNGTVTTLLPDSTPIIPMTMVYNTTYYGTGATGGSSGSSTSNGTIYYNNTTVELGNRLVNYRFGAPASGATNRTMLTVAISEDFRYFEYLDKYYMFVGFTTGEGVTSGDLYKEFVNSVPSGQLTAVFVEIQQIEINLTSGGTYVSSVTNEALNTTADLSRLTSITEVETANRYVEIAMATGSFNATPVPTPFNYVVFGSDIVIYPVESSGYTINTAQYSDGINTDSIPKTGRTLTIVAGATEDSISISSAPAGSKQYSMIIKNYRQRYSFTYQFSDAYVTTIKQYEMSSMSDSAIAKLYKTNAYTMLVDADTPYTKEYLEGLTSTQATNFFAYTPANVLDYMTGSYSLGENYIIYFFAQAATSVVGFYENGRALVDAVTNPSLFVPKFTANIGGSDYKVYEIYYGSTNGGACVIADSSLEVRFTTSIAVQTQVVGDGGKQLPYVEVDGKTVYPYDAIFDSSMLFGFIIRILGIKARLRDMKTTHNGTVGKCSCKGNIFLTNLNFGKLNGKQGVYQACCRSRILGRTVTKLYFGKGDGFTC